jgi:choline dehydrogenase
VNTGTNPLGGTEIISFIDNQGRRMLFHLILRFVIITHTRIPPGSSSAIAFLDSKTLDRPNLKVLIQTTVTRVLFTSSEFKIHRAVGVELAQSPQDETHFRVVAKREVILCAGAINTPQLLLLSGIGLREQLEKFGIEVVVD